MKSVLEGKAGEQGVTVHLHLHFYTEQKYSILVIEWESMASDEHVLNISIVRCLPCKSLVTAAYLT